MSYQRGWGCFIALYGTSLIVLGLALGDEMGIFIDVVGLAMVALGFVLIISYYVNNPPK